LQLTSQVPALHVSVPLVGATHAEHGSAAQLSARPPSAQVVVLDSVPARFELAVDGLLALPPAAAPPPSRIAATGSPLPAAAGALLAAAGAFDWAVSWGVGAECPLALDDAALEPLIASESFRRIAEPQSLSTQYCPDGQSRSSLQANTSTGALTWHPTTPAAHAIASIARKL
jgi:hypothetical protein